MASIWICSRIRKFAEIVFSENRAFAGVELDLHDIVQLGNEILLVMEDNFVPAFSRRFQTFKPLILILEGFMSQISVFKTSISILNRS